MIQSNTRLTLGVVVALAVVGILVSAGLAGLATTLRATDGGLELETSSIVEHRGTIE